MAHSASRAIRRQGIDTRTTVAASAWIRCLYVALGLHACSHLGFFCCCCSSSSSSSSVLYHYKCVYCYIAASDTSCPSFLRLFALRAPQVTKTKRVSSDEALFESVSDYNSVQMVGILQAPDCALNVTIAASLLHIEDSIERAMRYAFVMTAITVAQIVFSTRQIQDIGTNHRLARVSMLMLSIQALTDAVLAMVHVTVAVANDALFNAFVSAAFFQFCLYHLFEMRFILMIHRARNENDSYFEIRRELSALYVKLYVSLSLVLIFLYSVPGFVGWIALGASSFWVPQIISNAVENMNHTLTKSYIIGMTVTRLFFPLYIFGCPSSVWPISYRPYLAISLCLWVAFQVVILQLQVQPTTHYNQHTIFFYKWICLFICCHPFFFSS
jgi:hypothetical protein